MTNTKKFPLRVLLTVATGRLLTQNKGEWDNGINELHEILSWMTDSSPITYQIPDYIDKCKPWLLKWYPELAPCSVKSSLDSLDRWIKSDRTGGEEAIKMWLTELKMMFPTLKEEYDVPRIK